MFATLLRKLWSDESGAILSTEYIMLGSIVAAGGGTGMVALRDTMTEECKDFGASVRELRQSHMPKIAKPAAQPSNQYGAVGPLSYSSVPTTGNPVCVNCVSVTP